MPTPIETDRSAFATSLPVTHPKVGIVLVNYGQWTLTADCLASLQDLTYIPGHVVVVDNASPDDSIEQLQRLTYPFELVCSDHNRGFAGGVNLGIHAALAHGADYIWLLNNDTVVPVNALAPMVALAQKTGGLVGSVLIAADGSQTHVGTRFNWWTGRPRSVDLQAYTRHPHLDALCGGSLLIPKAVIDTIGLLDESYFLYLEDCEYAVRAKRAGFSLSLATEAYVVHVGGASTQKIPGAATYYSHRNRMRLMDQYASPMQQWFMRKYVGFRLLRTGLKTRFHPSPLAREALQQEFRLQRQALVDWAHQRWGQAEL